MLERVNVCVLFIVNLWSKQHFTSRYMYICCRTNQSIIVGTVIGVLVLLTIVTVAVVIFLVQRRRAKNEELKLAKQMSGLDETVVSYTERFYFSSVSSVVCLFCLLLRCQLPIVVSGVMF